MSGVVSTFSSMAALARAQADLVNRTRVWLRARRVGTLVLMSVRAMR